MRSKVTPLQKSLNLWAIILIAWSIYRTYFKMPEWFDEFIAKPIVFVLPVIYYLKKIDKKDVLSSLYIKLKPRQILSDVVYSIIIALLFLGTAFFAYYFKTKRILLIGNITSTGFLLMVCLTALATGITEEILSRGFVLKKLYEESRNPISSTFFSAILFFFLHVPILFSNAKINGNMLIMFMGTDLLLSMVNGLIFIQRKSLTVPILLHAFYNILISLVIT